MTLGKRIAMVCITFAIGVPTLHAAGDEQRPLRLIVPFQPGGQGDIVARAVADKMSQNGQAMIVDNRPGAGGQIAMKLVLEAEPDGRTLVMGSVATMATRPNALAKPAYDPIKDFSAVSLIASSPYVVVVNKSSTIKAISDLIAAAKAAPGKLTYGSSGAGSGMHLTTELFGMMTGLKFVHVAYKGSAPATVDLLGDQISFLFDNLPPAMPHIKSGQLRALAVTTKTRLSTLPGVPTVQEAGVSGFESGSWSGIVVRRGTNRGAVDALYRKLHEALASSSDFKKRLEMLGNTTVVSTPDDFTAFIKAENEKWADVIRAIGLTL